MSSSYVLCVDNQALYEFYQQHDLHFETMNVLFMNILSKILKTTDTSLNQNVTTMLMSKMQQMDHKMSTLQDSLSKSYQDLNIMLNLKAMESSKEYNAELKSLLALNNQEQLEPLLQKCNHDMLQMTLDKIKASFPFPSLLSVGVGGGDPQDGSAMAPTSELEKLFSSSIAQHSATMLSETQKLLSSASIDKQCMEDFRTNLAVKLTENQATLSTMIHSSEYRLEQKISELREATSTNLSSQQTLQKNVSDILKKFENSSIKGNLSENIVTQLLVALFPSADIQHVGNEQKETGDILLMRTNKPLILIENKEHESRNVGRPEVEKFIRDCNQQNCCGIMMAQHKGIANKENFEIQFDNNNVLLYLHNVHFDPEIIKLAVEIVESLKEKIDEMQKTDDTIFISKEVLAEINKDYQLYFQQKQTLLKLLKDSNDKLMATVQEMKMPGLERYLQSNYAFAGAVKLQPQNICPYCDTFVSKSMAQHYRHCAGYLGSQQQQQQPQNTVSSLLATSPPTSPPIKKGRQPKAAVSKK